jgi:hypothetical protein
MDPLQSASKTPQNIPPAGPSARQPGQTFSPVSATPQQDIISNVPKIKPVFNNDILPGRPVASTPTVPAPPVITQSTIEMPVNQNIDNQSLPTMNPPKNVAKQTKTKVPKSKKIIRMGSLVLIILIIVCAYLLLTKSNSPITVFNKALSNALSTKSFEQITSVNGSREDIKFNTSNVLEPVLSSNVTIDFLVAINQSGYGTLQNTFIKYNSLKSSSGLGISSADLQNISYLKKWIIVKTNGINPSGSESVEAYIDPDFDFFGQYIFGNFSNSQRQQLLNYIKSNNIYQFNPKNVTTGTVNGRKVYVYQVGLNIEKLSKYNDMVASMMKLSLSNISSTISSLNSIPKSETFYIDKRSSELLQISESTNGTKSTISYQNFNDIKLPSQPKPELTWSKFQQEQEADSTNTSF